MDLNQKLPELHDQTIELIKANQLEAALEAARQAYQLATQYLPPGSPASATPPTAWPTR